MTQQTDWCTFPQALSEDDLAAALAGDAEKSITAHLAACPSCSSRFEILRRELSILDGGLRAGMFRLGCPDPEALADFAASGLKTDAQIGIDYHLSTCLRCSTEVSWLREALAAPATLAQPVRRPTQAGEPFERHLVRQLQRIAGTLRPVQHQLALRGDTPTRAFSANFPGGQAFMELTQRGAGHRLTGQLIFDADDAAWQGAFVQIFASGGLAATALTDDMLEFAGDLPGDGSITLNVTALDGRQLELGVVA
ncbi:MAG: hypothetical protein ABIQ99_04700 [Thermoflexales bacterium]